LGSSDDDVLGAGHHRDWLRPVVGAASVDRNSGRRDHGHR
jgi:hypothetical protein